jgi:hypothetical protein
MTQTTTESKKKTQLNFDFSLARNPDYIRTDNKEEKGKVHYLVPKEKVEDKKVPNGTFFRKQTFFNVDFRYGHTGLNELAKQAGLNLKNLAAGNVVVFFNNDRNQMKIAFSDQGIYHWRQNGKIEERAIDDVIRQFTRTGKMSYEDGLTAFLKRRGIGVDETTVKKNTRLN